MKHLSYNYKVKVSLTFFKCGVRQLFWVSVEHVLKVRKSIIFRTKVFGINHPRK